MILEAGRVVRTQGELAWVEATSRRDCARCAEGKGCGGGLLGRWLGDRLHRIRVDNPDQIPEGAWVEMALDERVLLLAALAAYVPPLLGLLLASAVAVLLFEAGEGVVILAGLVGFGLGVGVAAFLSGKRGGRHWCLPRVVKRLDGPPPGCKIDLAA